MENVELDSIKAIMKIKTNRKYRQNQINTKTHKELKFKSKSYYYKTKYNITSEDIINYGEHLSLVVRIRSNLDELKLTKPELIYDILKCYL
jgi:hypothetical protein